MLEFLGNLFSPDYLPLGYSMKWQSDLITLHVASDTLIALAFYSIPYALYIFYRQRKDLVYPSTLLLLAGFIFACGTIHLLNILTMWIPVYRFDAALKAITAAISVTTAIVLWPTIPRLLNLPSSAQLRQINQDLNENIRKRIKIEQELTRKNAEIEQKVKEKTENLRASNNLLLQEIERREDLEQKLYHFAAIVESTKDAILSKNLDGTILSWNKAAERIYGYSAEEIVGKSVFTLLPNNAGDDITPILQQIRAGISIDNHETRRKTKDGRLIHVSLSVSPLRDNLGNIQGASVIARDISERIISERAREESERLFRNTFEQAAVGMAHVFPDGRFIRVNRRYGDIIGYSHNEMIKLTFQEITHPEDLEADVGYVKKCLAGTIDNYKMDKRYIAKNGEVVWVRLTVSLVRNDNDNPDYFIAVVEDISERIAARQELEIHTRELIRSNEELEQFAYIASHDLKEPLRKIMTFGERLSEHLKDKITEEPLDYLNRMTSAAIRMAEMIDGLLRFSQVGRSLSKQKTDLNKIIEDVKTVFNKTIEEKKATLICDTLPKVDVDPTLMRQLFQNLISNALKFHKEKQNPHIEVRFEPNAKSQMKFADREQGRFIAISVADKGIGFDMENSYKIFSLFQRLHGRTRYEGSGIGLAICKKVAEAHGGYMKVKSTPGQGSSFTLFLPMDKQ